MNLLPLNTALGELRVTEIYDYFDGPKLFCASNSLDSLFLVYWCDKKDDGAEGWLYLPITEVKLEALRQSQLSLRDAFLSPENNGLYHVYTAINSSDDIATYYSENEIDKLLFPPEDEFISYDDISFIGMQSESFDEGKIEWNHEVRIRKNNKKTFPSSEAVTSVLYLWTDIIQSVMSSLKKNQTIYPVMAQPGSFKMKFNTLHKEIGDEALVRLNDIIQSNNDIVEKLYKAEIEPYKLKELFEIAVKFKLKIEISPKNKSQLSKPILINYDEASNWISLLEPVALSVLGTDKIPQANDIEKVVTVLEHKRDGIYITPNMINVTSDRQVKYYTDAGYTLGLLTKDGFLTSQGRFLLSKDDNMRYVVMADRFESSDVGWSWISWSKINSMVDLNPDTASDFLLKVVPGLSINTAKRRATTLVMWLKVLTPYHRDY